MIMLENQLNILKYKTKYKKLLDNTDYRSLIKFVKDRPIMTLDMQLKITY